MMMGSQQPNTFQSNGQGAPGQSNPSFMSGIGDLLQAFGLSRQNFTNPANAGMSYLNQIPGATGQYYNPYINSGRSAMGTLMGQYGNLTNNPGQFLNQMGQGFQQSPGYQFQVNQALGSANRAGAASGMAGSPMEQQNLAGTVNNLANQDYYNWLNHATGLYDTGLQGLQGINQMGFDASNAQANDLAHTLMSQANMAYAGQANQNQFNQGQQGGMWGMLGSGIGDIGSYFGL